MIFKYTRPYTFSAAQNGKPIQVTDLEVYIKLDINKETRRGYAAMSFHSPEFEMKFPYADYPTDRE